MIFALWALLQTEEPVTALVGGDVYTVTHGVLRGGTILIKGDKISAVGASVEIPEGAARVELKGFRVYPGWVAASARGIGGFSGEGKLGDSLDPFHLSMKLGVACGITSAYLQSGGGFGGSSVNNAVMRLTVGEVDKIIWQEPAAVEMTSSWIGAASQARYELRDKFQKAKEYLAKKKDYDARKAAGKLEKDEKEPAKPGESDAQMKLLTGESRARMDASTWPQIRLALDLVEEFPFKLTLIGVEEGWIQPDALARAGVACVLDPRSRRDPDKTLNRPSGSTIELAAILHRAGVKVAVIPPGTDLGTDGLGGRNLMTLPLSAAFAIRGGLSEQAALESITIAAAEIVGIADKAGSIEAGKAADLIVLDGDPFHYATLVQKTYVAGREVYDKNTSLFFKHIRPKEIKVSAPSPKKKEEPKPERKETPKEENPAETPPK